MRLTNTLRVTIVAIVAIVALCLTALATPANAQYPDTLAAPDLVLIGVTSAATAALAGERVAVGADVLNVGTAPAVASRLKYYFSADATFDAGDKYLNYDKVSALSPGQSSAEVANVRIPYGTVDGAWFVLLVADDWSEVAEADETNNVAALAITVGELLPPTPAMP
ncbi:MAG: subtilase family serine protease, partial [Myxococcota bacterium]